MKWLNTRKAAEIYTHTHTHTHTHTRVVLLSLFSIINFNAYAADVLDLDSALQNTYTACVGIDDKLSEYKKLAGINTAIQAVGTGVGAGATAVGIVKVATDKEAHSYEKLLEELKEKTKDVEYHELTEEEIDAFEKEFDLAYDSAVKDIEKYEAELDKLNTKSRKLGNWRTGLMAGATATNITGAILASKSGASKDLQEMVDGCLASLDQLTNSMMQARLNGQDISEAQEIFDACREYKTVNISSIAKRAKGSEITSIIGATTGAVGTVVSGVANSDKVRADNTEQGEKKEKNLNTAANVFAGATTVSSAASTVFSGTQIAAIKRVANVAAKCEGVLK